MLQLKKTLNLLDSFISYKDCKYLQFVQYLQYLYPINAQYQSPSLNEIHKKEEKL